MLQIINKIKNKLYEGWFGIPFKLIEQEQINKLRGDLIQDNDNENNNTFNTFLNKKRANKIYLYESNSTFDPNNSYENNEEEKEEKSKINSENEESSINIENITIPENIIEDNKGIITYNGLFDHSKKINIHYIYLNTDKEINMNKRETVYKWKIKFIKFSNKKNYIGIGLAEKDIVLKNKNIFINSKENFYNGVFCLLCKYLEDRNSNSIFAKHPKKDMLDDYIVNFPPFKQGQEIIYSHVLSFFIKGMLYKFLKQRKIKKMRK